MRRARAGPTSGRGRGLDTDALLLEFAATRDRRTRNLVIERSTPLADAVATRLSTPANREDLRQVARLGLLHAVERFDPEVGAPFGAFAVRTIEGECKRYLRDRTWTVRPPRRAQELHLDLRRMDDQLTQRFGRSPTLEELADATGTTVESVLEALEARGAHHGVSLDGAPTNDASDAPLTQFLGRDDDRYDDLDLRLEIEGLLGALPEVDRRLIEARFFQGRSQQQIADEMGISQSYLSRVLRRVLLHLRDELDDPGVRSPRSAGVDGAGDG